MKRKRTDWRNSAPRAPASSAPRPGTDDDPWAGEDVIWLEEDLARRWLTDTAPQPVNASVPSFLRVVLVCALLGALLWALAGYGLFRLIAG
ncbi:MAG: hypothetical protein ACRDON_02890 [Gaiellaceae bacterium]